MGGGATASALGSSRSLALSLRPLRDDGTRVLCVWWKGGGWGEATHIAWRLTRVPAIAVVAAAVHPPPATTQVLAAAMIYDINSPLFKSYLTVGGVKT